MGLNKWKQLRKKKIVEKVELTLEKDEKYNAKFGTGKMLQMLMRLALVTLGYNYNLSFCTFLPYLLHLSNKNYLCLFMSQTN